MSHKGNIYKIKKQEILSFIPSILLTALIFLVALYLADDLSEYVKDGISLSINVIIPSVFPFLILSDILINYIHYDKVTRLRTFFERIFKINGAMISAYILGLLCGYPIGARMALTSYENGIIDKDECERLMSFSNNASPAYIICAVGGGLRGSIKEGALLYIITIISSTLSGILSRNGKKCCHFTAYIPEQKYNFFHSIRNSIQTSISIGGFITVFSVFFGLIETIIKNKVVLSLILPFLEISNACAFLSDLCIFPSSLTFSLSALAISFSGICVATQTLAIIPDGVKINTKRYFKIKLLQGLIAFILSYIIYSIFI